MIFQEELVKSISDAFRDIFSVNVIESDLKLQPTNKEFQGSHTFVTFPFLKLTKKKPEETAQLIGNYLKENSGLVEDFNAVKGFLNLVIVQKYWIEHLAALLEDAEFGRFKSNGKKILVEFSSPNTNKPLHLGHLRNNFLGASISRILETAGLEVIKANLVNDRGIHICKSMLAYQKYGEGETPETAGIKGDHLVGKYYVRFDQEYKKEIETLIQQGQTEEEAKAKAPLILEAQQMLRQWEDGVPEVVELWKTMNGWVYQGFDQTYQNLGIAFDHIYYESDTYKLGKDIVEEGLSSGAFYRKDDGSVWVKLDGEGLEDKLLLRSDGTSVYITQDLGTADLKYRDYGFDQSIYVVGNEQDYHFEVLFTILKKLNRPYAGGLYHLSYGMVDLPSGKMKSREGTVVDADDLVQEMIETAEKHTRELGKIEGFSDVQARKLYEILGIGALKYFLLRVDPKKRMLFNPEESIQFHGFTGPFIQYTHARIISILNKARQVGISEKLVVPDQNSNLLEPVEQDILFLLSFLPERIMDSARAFDPSLLAQYIFEIAKEYNRFYAEVPIFAEEDEWKKIFRVNLSAQVARTINLGMGLLGIEVPDRM
jgi:arginyl-tRNA synthetase